MEPDTSTALPSLRISASDHERLRLLVATVIQAQPRLRETLEPLRVELERAAVLPAEVIPPTVVVMGSRVEIEDRESGEVDTYTLVYPEQADAAAGRLSILAPIGTAIIGFAQGDTFAWRTPGGTRQLFIRKVEPPEKFAG
jgi:regulator of nucleoside diphosphate kinase